jgi:APA family basic amino acid/polyamine antiporter
LSNTTDFRLQRQLGFRSATALVVGEVIGVGIFLTPAAMARSIGSPMWLLAVWLTMGLMALCGALCYGELAARFPEVGGGYVYLREAYGPVVAFLFGWMALLVLDPGLTAALAVGMAGYVGYVLNVSPLATKLVAIGAVWLLAAINIFGVRLGAWLLRFLTLAKVGLLLFVIVWGFALGLGNWSNFVPLVAQRPNSSPLVGALAGGLVAAFFSFGGWWDASKVAGEVKDPEHALPRALSFGVVIVTLIYIATSASFFYLIPLEQVTSGETFAAQAGAALFGRVGSSLFSVIVIIAVFGSLAAYIMSAPRVYYAMARDRLFFPAAAAVHPRFGTPARATMLQAMLASVLISLGTFNDIVAYFIFVVVVFVALTVGGTIILRRRLGAPQTFRTPLYPLTPILFLALVILLLVLLGMNSPIQAMVGSVIVLAGIPVYYFFFRRDRIEQS